MQSLPLGSSAVIGLNESTPALDVPPRFPAFLFWKAATAEPVAARVAIAGDFSPPRQVMSASAWNQAAAPLADYFDDVDTSFVSFDGTLGEGVLSLFPQQMDLRMAPPEALDYLESIKARAIAVAHDQGYGLGSSGFGHTKDLFLRRGMVPLGAGKMLRKAPSAWVWRGPGGIRVGFWAAARTAINAATRSVPGVEPATLDRALYALECLRYHQAQCRIALLNLGPQADLDPAPSEMDLVDSLAKWGFDIVCTSHSPRIRGARRITGHRGISAFTFHGLGCIASREAYSEPRPEGLVVVAGLDLQGNLVQIEIRPVVLDQSGFAAIPEIPVAAAVLERFERLSRSLQRRIEHSPAGRASGKVVEFQIPAWSSLHRKLHQSPRMMRVRQLVQKIIG